MLRRHFNALFLALPRSTLRAQAGGPRLLLNPGKIEALRAAITTTHAALWGSAKRKADGFAAASLDDLIQAGLIRPPLQMERTYKGVHLTAIVQQGGKVEFGGQIYDSLSTAAGMAQRSVIGSPTGRPYPQTNGWTFCMYRSENDALSEIDRMRKQYLAQSRLMIVPPFAAAT